MKLNILFSPSHYIYDLSKWGSEISWVFNIVDRVSKRINNSVVVTGSNQLKQQTVYKIIEVQHDKNYLDLGIINSLLYNFKYTLKTHYLLQHYKFDLLHHVLPFGIGNTFNLAIIFRDKNLPVVIGPIQAPLNTKDSDLGMSMTAEQTSKKSTFFLDNLFIRFFRPLLYRLSLVTLQKATKIVVINNKTKNLLVSMGISNKNIIIISPGIDTKIFCPSKRKSIKKRKFTIITTSKLLNRKRIDLIIKAIGEVAKQDKNIHLMIVGDGPQKESLVNLVHELKLEKIVTFEGYVTQDKIVQYYQQADLFVSMSEDESWGQVYLEAMSCGLSVITTRNDGSVEIIEENKSGYFVDQNDYSQLSTKIIQVINDSSRINKMAKYSIKCVDLNYDWNKTIIPQYINIYKEMAGANKI